MRYTHRFTAEAQRQMDYSIPTHERESTRMS